LSGDNYHSLVPDVGAPAFNGGTEPSTSCRRHPQALGFHDRWQIHRRRDEAWQWLRALIDRGLPVQVGTHYSLILPYGAKTSPRLEFVQQVRPGPGFGHHIVIAGYDLQRETVTVYEPNDVLPHARYECPINVFRRAGRGAAAEGGHYTGGRTMPWGE
jgi:hypothetical protein